MLPVRSAGRGHVGRGRRCVRRPSRGPSRVDPRAPDDGRGDRCGDDAAADDFARRRPSRRARVGGYRAAADSAWRRPISSWKSSSSDACRERVCAGSVVRAVATFKCRSRKDSTPKRGGRLRHLRLAARHLNQPIGDPGHRRDHHHRCPGRLRRSFSEKHSDEWLSTGHGIGCRRPSCRRTSIITCRLILRVGD